MYFKEEHVECELLSSFVHKLRNKLFSLTSLTVQTHQTIWLCSRGCTCTVSHVFSIGSAEYSQVEVRDYNVGCMILPFYESDFDGSLVFFYANNKRIAKAYSKSLRVSEAAFGFALPRPRSASRPISRSAPRLRDYDR